MKKMKGDIKMKKIVSTILVCVLLLGCVMSLASCGKTFTGTYTTTTLLGSVDTYEFKIGGKVVLTHDPIVGNTDTFEGKYEINDETGEITFVFENEDAHKTYGGTKDFSTGSEDDVKYIKIDGWKYTEVTE